LKPTDPSLPAPVWIRTDRLPEGILPPAGLAVVLVEDSSGAVTATLNWNPEENLEEAGLVGYALMVDYAQEGNVRRLNSLPPLSGPEFSYALPSVKDRRQFTFRLAAITKENKLGPFAEATVLLPEPTEEEIPQ
jgi:hypothetical protein